MTDDGHRPDFRRIAFIDLEASGLGSAPAFPPKSAGQWSANTVGWDLVLSGSRPPAN